MRRTAVLPASLLALFFLSWTALPAQAQNAGGLYVAGAGFSFAQAARQALSENPGGGGRFFVLVLPPATDALAASGASAEALELRAQVQARGGSLLVCRRDVAAGAMPAAGLMPGVQVVRGWPQPGGPQLAANSDYYPDESPAALPAATDVLHRLRAACSS